MPFGCAFRATDATRSRLSLQEELKHSLRSVFQEMGIHGDVRTFHLVLGDWALGGDTTPVVDEFFGTDRAARSAHDQGREWRVGQMPAWLDASLLGLERAGLTVKVHHHAETFKDRTATDEEAALRYRTEALPNFNAYGCRSRFDSSPCADGLLHSPASRSRPSSSTSPAWRQTSSTSTTTSS